MTQPVWDGEGVDPWLSARLYAAAEVAEVERDIREVFWAVLSRWLVETARRVLRGTEPPDLNAVWARVPAWHDAVDQVVNGRIRDAMGVAYRRVLGEDYSWKQRAAVAVYLSEVRNRLVRVPDEVYELVAGQVVQGVNLGESVPKLAARVDEVLSTTGSERWPNRSTVVARTETIGALNAARLDAFRVAAEEEPDVRFEKMWLATVDARTRDTHRAADGQRVPLDASFSVGAASLAFPGDPTGPAREVIQCRCTMLLVEPGESVDMSDRQFREDR